MDYLKLYDQETYLFDVVRKKFKEDGKLLAFDFFCIVIWKANRAKSKIAQRLIKQGKSKDLNAIVEELTSAIATAASGKERLHFLIEKWGFRLPMASAILTVFYPEEFTVYDVRICEELKDIRDYSNLKNISDFEKMWKGYQDLIADLSEKEKEVFCLRDKDRTLWAKSFEKQLSEDIKTSFVQQSSSTITR